ncbi:MAG: transcription termination/antitermination NusG family protein [Pyrinomonadaceae bacterium]
MDSEKASDVHRWYAIRTHPKQEDRANSNLLAWQVETFYPKLKERLSNPYTGKPTYVSKPLFPRYIFARFDVSKLLNKVWYTRGVHSVVNFGDGPIPISDEIINLVQSQIGEDGFVRIGEELNPGDQVIVKDGPLKDFTGVFERQTKAKDRIMILLTTATYQGRVMVDRKSVNKLNQVACTA